MAGPPLWYCPVECRKRGPQPKVVGRPVRRASAARLLGQLRVGEPVEVGHHRDVALVRVELVEQRVERRRDGGRRPEPVAAEGAHLDGAVGEGRLGGRAAGGVEQPAGRLLGALDVGLVERVDAQQPAGGSGRDLPQQQLGAQGAADVDLGARRPRPRRPAARGVSSESPTRRATVTSAAGQRTSGSSAPATTTGRTPVPSLPVLSAISCSAQSAKPTMPDPLSTMASLSRSGDVPAIAAARRRPGLASSSSASRSATASASSSRASMSAPARPLGTSPKAVSAE